MGEIKQAKEIREKAYDLEERLIDFAVRIIRMIEDLPNTRVAIILLVNYFVAVPLLLQIMVKLKVPNRVLTLSIR